MKRLFRGWSWEHWYNLAREDIEAAFDSVRQAVRIAVYCGLGLWVLSGFHIVRSDEVGVVTICGSVTRGVENPGLRYRLPWPVGAVRKVAVQRQQRVTIGLSQAGLTAAQRMGKVDEKALDTTVANQFEKDTETKGSSLDKMIKEGQKKATQEEQRMALGEGLHVTTADHNVINLQAVVQFLIKDPKRYIYASEGAELMLTRLVENALLAEASWTSVDDLLTTARTDVQSRVKQTVNDQVKPLGLGIEVAGVELQKVVPPEAVNSSFRAVNTAREERNTIINEAQQYAGTVVPEAQGQADQIVQEANSFKANRLAEARGEASRFSGVLSQYQSTGPLTAERLRIETIERALGRANRVQVGGSNNTGIDVNIVPQMPGSDQ